MTIRPQDAAYKAAYETAYQIAVARSDEATGLLGSIMPVDTASPDLMSSAKQIATQLVAFCQTPHQSDLRDEWRAAEQVAAQKYADALVTGRRVVAARDGEADVLAEAVGLHSETRARCVAANRAALAAKLRYHVAVGHVNEFDYPADE